MELIALHGPPCTGKTAVARELEKRGYLFIDFCDIIKQEAARALTYLGVGTSVHEVRTKKDKYRPLLQTLGDLIGFNNDPKYVYRALWDFGFSGSAGRLAVFDNVRTVEQFQILKYQGFQLVRLDAPLLTRVSRAQQKYGVTIEKFMEQESHPIEQGIGLEQYISLSVDAEQPVERIADILMQTRIKDAA